MNAVLRRFVFVGALLVSMLSQAYGNFVCGAERDGVQWDFESESNDGLSFHGNVVRDQEGPRPPEYPDFSSNNQAIRLDKGGAYVSVPDLGGQSVFDFTNGDEITLEAWVKIDNPGTNSPMVIVGKGRHGNSKFAQDNQNWALRVVGNQGEFKLNFLFSSGVRTPGPADQHWHRWTSHVSFVQSTGWHHLAVSYVFGKPESIRGWIDGVATDGAWDMGGATTLAPVVDDDEIRISSANAGNQFVGLIDQIRIHRKTLDDKSIASRFNRVGGPRTATLADEVAPTIGEIPSSRVLVTLHESMPKADRWYYQGESVPSESIRWESSHLLLSRIPNKFDGWGIRDDWNAPVLLRMACDVQVPPGKHKVWLRVRGVSRLWADNEIISRTGPAVRAVRDGEQIVTPVVEPPLPGYRPAGYHQQEIQKEWQIALPTEVPGTSVTKRLVLETIVGGPSKRTETGEISVAIQFEGSDELVLLGPSGQEKLLLKDSQVQSIVSSNLESVDRLEEVSRRAANANRADYWERRHAFAKQVLAENARVNVPDPQIWAKFKTNSTNPIDWFLVQKKENNWAIAQNIDTKASAEFHTSVLPILREHCFRCHSDKASGGLRLDRHAGLFEQADSGIPAVVAGNPAESELIAQVRSGAMPPTDKKLSELEMEKLEQWIKQGATWPAKPLDEQFDREIATIDDASYLRRIYLDTIGIPPTASELQDFVTDSDKNKRDKLIDRLLSDPRTADHWISFWQDLLAENPTLINQSIGSTGPFRWYLLDALRDGKSVDRMVTELVMMRGSAQTGGTAAFGLAGETDAPMAAKGGILASAFLGIETQCARCHDSPYHSSKQEDLYAIAAMLDRKNVKVPVTSQVPAAFFEKKGRESLISVTLKPDQSIAPKWPFGSEDYCNGDLAVMSTSELDKDFENWLEKPDDTREQFAYLLTSSRNLRFAQVFANRIWKRLIGSGIVEPVDDWEGKQPSHPELLRWLGDEFVRSGYDWRQTLKQILSSELYAKQAIGSNEHAPAEERYFHGPDSRRLAAEQIVDSLHSVLGKPFDSEELTFVHDGERTLGQRQTLGIPSRAWMFTSLNNERDRPSLALPRAAAIVDVLEAFGWTGSRQRPISTRDESPNVLQPGILANGAMVRNLIRVTHGSEASEIALKARSAEELVQIWFQRILGRVPRSEEISSFVGHLGQGFEGRVVDKEAACPVPPPPLPQVTWFNHLRPETSTIQIEHERRVETGPEPDPRFDTQWRETYEDFLWSLVNDPSFVWYP